mmetsp:Transcript_61604/g.101780  ORF Transcript_61604/g.101780 Transcript_61604/m.101780 type:complete len:210 (-) Transcript_61604:528-1157(-)
MSAADSSGTAAMHRVWVNSMFFRTAGAAAFTCSASITASTRCVAVKSRYAPSTPPGRLCSPAFSLCSSCHTEDLQAPRRNTTVSVCCRLTVSARASSTPSWSSWRAFDVIRGVATGDMRGTVVLRQGTFGTGVCHNTTRPGVLPSQAYPPCCRVSTTVLRRSSQVMLVGILIWRLGGLWTTLISSLHSSTAFRISAFILWSSSLLRHAG